MIFRLLNGEFIFCLVSIVPNCVQFLVSHGSLAEHCGEKIGSLDRVDMVLLVTLAGYCIRSTTVPLQYPIFFLRQVTKKL
jgi:hypothetical protein